MAQIRLFSEKLELGHLAGFFEVLGLAQVGEDEPGLEFPEEDVVDAFGVVEMALELRKDFHIDLHGGKLLLAKFFALLLIFPVQDDQFAVLIGVDGLIFPVSQRYRLRLVMIASVIAQQERSVLEEFVYILFEMTPDLI